MLSSLKRRLLFIKYSYFNSSTLNLSENNTPLWLRSIKSDLKSSLLKQLLFSWPRHGASNKHEYVYMYICIHTYVCISLLWSLADLTVRVLASLLVLAKSNKLSYATLCTKVIVCVVVFVCVCMCKCCS